MKFKCTKCGKELDLGDMIYGLWCVLGTLCNDPCPDNPLRCIDGGSHNYEKQEEEQ